MWAPVKGGAGWVELSKGQNVPCHLTLTLVFYICSVILKSKELHDEMRFSLYVCTHQGNTRLEPEEINFIILFVYFCHSFTQTLTEVVAVQDKAIRVTSWCCAPGACFFRPMKFSSFPLCSFLKLNVVVPCYLWGIASRNP